MKRFFKKLWYSLDKIDKYSELSAEGLGKAIKYLIVLIMILAMVSSLSTVYTTRLVVKHIAQYIEENAPELTYSEGTLTVDSEDVIIDENNNFGKIIIDTKTEDEEKVNEYVENVKEEENAIIILKNKLIMKEVGIENITNYNYEELFQEINITEFNKQDLVNYLNGSSIIPMYLNLTLIMFIYAFVIYLINTILNVFLISVIGYLTSMLLKLKIRYVAIFNMAVYAITLPTILQMLYIGINAFYPYIISYFDVMYILVASIYMIAAIFILKAEFNKTQNEVQKIVEVQEEVKKEIEEKQKEDKKENKETDKQNKEKDKKDEKQETDGEQPEGSNA